MMKRRAEIEECLKVRELERERHTERRERRSVYVRDEKV